MANINKIKIGQHDPDKIMYDSYYISPNAYKFDFTKWELNPAYNNSIEITNNRIVIKKFKPNVWIMRSPKVNGPFAKAICEYCNGTLANITGLTSNLSLFGSEYHSFNDHGAGNDTPKFRGLCMYPMFPSGVFINQSCYAWENCWDSPDTKGLPPINDFPAFRLDSANGHGSFGLYHDSENFLLFPDNLYDINSWRRGQTVDMCYGLMIATGKVESFDINAWSSVGNAGKIVGNKIIYTGRDPKNSDHSIRKWSNIMGFRIKITGLSEGDYVLYGQLNKLKDETATKFTTSGEYDIPVGWGGGNGGYCFSVRGTGNSQVTIETVNPLVDSEGLIDISSNPIFIELPITEEVDISSAECWDVMIGEECVYHKDKTLMNCWGEYNIAYPTTLGIDDTTFESNPNVEWITPHEFYINAPSGQFILNEYNPPHSFNRSIKQKFSTSPFFLNITLPDGIEAIFSRYFVNINESYDETYKLKAGRNNIPILSRIVTIKDPNNPIEYHKFKLTINNSNKIPTKIRVRITGNLDDTIEEGDTRTITVNTNSWVKYGYNSLIVPDIVEFNQPDKLNNLMSRTKWIHTPKNFKFWDKIKEWYSENSAWGILLKGGTFSGSNIDGIDIVIDKIIYPKESTDKLFYGEDNFANSQIQTINIIQRDDAYRISSAQRFFRSAKKLRTINIQTKTPDGFICGANSIVDGFSNTDLETYPERLINWGADLHYNRQSHPNSLCHWGFIGSKRLKTIPSFPDPSNNTIHANNNCENMFNNCISLTDVGPILDLGLVHPNTSKSMFYNCTKLANIKIYKLNHGDWHFESSEAFNGYLPALSAESIKYLIDNLADLTTSDPDKQSNTPSKSFDEWKSDFKNTTSLVDNDYRFDNLDVLSLRKRYSDYSTAVSIASTDKALENMNISFYNDGPIEGDEIIFGTESKPDTYKLSTTNRSITINKPSGEVIHIRFVNKVNQASRNSVSIKIQSSWDSTNPVVNHATLYGPSQWNDKITPDMISSAKSKGWTLNIGGSIK